MDIQDERNKTDLHAWKEFSDRAFLSVGQAFDNAVVSLPANLVAAENAPPSAAAPSAFAGVPAAMRHQPVLFPGAPRSLPVPTVDPERFDKLRDLSLKDEETEETVTPPLSVRLVLPAGAQQEPPSTLCRIADPSSLWNRDRLKAGLCANWESAANTFPLQQMKPLNSYEARVRAADTEQLEKEFSRLAATSERFSFAAAPAGCSLPYSGLWHSASIGELGAGTSGAVPPASAAVGLDSWYAASATTTIAGAQRLLEALQQRQPSQQQQQTSPQEAAAAGPTRSAGRLVRQQHREAAEQIIRRHLELLTADEGRVTRCCPRAAAFLLEQLRQAGAESCRESERSFSSASATPGGRPESAAEAAETRKRVLFSSIELPQQQPVTDAQELALLGSAPLFTEDERLDNLLLLLLMPGVAPETALEAQLPAPLLKPPQQQTRQQQKRQQEQCWGLLEAQREGLQQQQRGGGLRSRRDRSHRYVAEDAVQCADCDPSIGRFSVESMWSLIRRIGRRLHQMEQQGNFYSQWNSLLPPLQEQELRKRQQHEQCILQGLEHVVRDEVEEKELLHAWVSSAWGRSWNGSENVTSAQLAAARARLAYIVLFGDEKYPGTSSASDAAGAGGRAQVQEERGKQSWVPPRQWVEAALRRLQQLLRGPRMAQGPSRIAHLWQELEKEEARFAAAGTAAAHARTGEAGAEAAGVQQHCQEQVPRQVPAQLQLEPPASWAKMGFSARVVERRAGSSAGAAEGKAAAKLSTTGRPSEPPIPEVTTKNPPLPVQANFAAKQNVLPLPVKKLPGKAPSAAAGTEEATGQPTVAKKLPPPPPPVAKKFLSRPKFPGPPVSEAAAQEYTAAKAGTAAAGDGDGALTPLAGGNPAVDGELKKPPLSFESAAQHASPKPTSSNSAGDYFPGVRQPVRRKGEHPVCAPATGENRATMLESAHVLQGMSAELPAAGAAPFEVYSHRVELRQQPMRQDWSGWRSAKGPTLDVEKPLVLMPLAEPYSQTAPAPAASLHTKNKRGGHGAITTAGDETAADGGNLEASFAVGSRADSRFRPHSSRLRRVSQEQPETFYPPPAEEDTEPAFHAHLFGCECFGGEVAAAADSDPLASSPAAVAATLKRIDYASGGGYAFLQSSVDALPSSSGRTCSATRRVGSNNGADGLRSLLSEAPQDLAEHGENPLLSPRWGGSLWRLELAARVRSAASAGREAAAPVAGRTARESLLATEGKPGREKQCLAGSKPGTAAAAGVGDAREFMQTQAENTSDSSSVFFARKAYVASRAAAAEETALEERYAYPGALISPGYFRLDEVAELQRRRQERKIEAQQFISVADLKVREKQEEAQRSQQRAARLAEAQKAALARGAVERKRRDEAQAKAKQLKLEEQKRLKEAEELQQRKRREAEQRRLQLQKLRQQRKEFLQQQLASSPADLALFYRESRRRRGERHPVTIKMKQILRQKLGLRKTAVKKPGVHRRRAISRGESLTEAERRRERAMRLAQQWAGRGEAALLMAGVLRGESGRKHDEGEEEQKEGIDESEEDIESVSTEYTYPSLPLSSYGSSADSAAAPLGHPLPTTYIAYRPVALRIPDVFRPRLAYSGVLLVEELPAADTYGESKSFLVSAATASMNAKPLLKSSADADATGTAVSPFASAKKLSAEAGSSAAAPQTPQGSPASNGHAKRLLRQRMYAQMRGQVLFFFVDTSTNLPAKPAPGARDAAAVVGTGTSTSGWTPSGKEEWKLLFGILIDSTTVVEKVTAPNPYLPIRVARPYPAIRVTGALNVNFLPVAPEFSKASTPSAVHTLVEDGELFKSSRGDAVHAAATVNATSDLASPTAVPSRGGEHDLNGVTSLCPAVGNTSAAGLSGDAPPPPAAATAGPGPAAHPDVTDSSADSVEHAVSNLHMGEAHHGALPPGSTVGVGSPLSVNEEAASRVCRGPDQQQTYASTAAPAATLTKGAKRGGHGVAQSAAQHFTGGSPLPKRDAASASAVPPKNSASHFPPLHQKNLFSEVEQQLAERKYVDFLLSADSLQETAVWISLLLRRVSLSKYEQAFAAAVVAARKVHALEATEVKELERRREKEEENVEEQQRGEEESGDRLEEAENVFDGQENTISTRKAAEVAQEEGAHGEQGTLTTGGASSAAREAGARGAEESGSERIRGTNGDGPGWPVAQSVADFCFSASQVVLSLKGVPYFKEADSVLFACLKGEQRVHILDFSNRLLKDGDLQEVCSLLPFQAHQVLLRANLLTAAADPLSVHDLVTRLHAASVDLSDNNYSSPLAGTLLFSLLFKAPGLHSIFLNRDRLGHEAVARFYEEVASCGSPGPTSSKKEVSLSGNKLTTADVKSLLHVDVLPQLAVLNLSNNTPAVEEEVVLAHLRAVRGTDESPKNDGLPAAGAAAKHEQQQQQREKGGHGESVTGKRPGDPDEEGHRESKGASLDGSNSSKSGSAAHVEDTRRSSGESTATKQTGCKTVPNQVDLTAREGIDVRVDFSPPQPPADGLLLPLAAGYADVEQMPVSMSGRLYASGWRQRGSRVFPHETALENFRNSPSEAAWKPPAQRHSQNDVSISSSMDTQKTLIGANAGDGQRVHSGSSTTAGKNGFNKAGTGRSGVDEALPPALVYFELRGPALVHYPLGIRDPSCWKEQERKQEKRPEKGWDYDLNAGEHARPFRGIYLHHLWVDSTSTPMLLRVQGFDVDAAAAAALPPAAPLHLLQQNPLLPLITYTLRGISETATIEWARLLHARLAGICYVRTEQAAANLLSGSAIQFFQGCGGTCLDFGGCPVSPAALQACFSYLCKYTWLKHLNLSNTRLRGAHLAALGGKAFELLKLEVLDLSFNCLTGDQEDADLLLEVLSFRGCHRLILDHNPTKGTPAFAKVLVRVACCMEVEIFAANACGLSDGFAKAVTDNIDILKLEQTSEQSMDGRRRVGEGTLHTLEIERNSFSSSGLQVLVDALTAAVPTLQVVKAYGNPVKQLFSTAKTVELQGAPESGKPRRIDRRLQSTRSAAIADTSEGLETAKEAAAVRELLADTRQRKPQLKTTERTISLTLKERYGV